MNEHIEGELLSSYLDGAVSIDQKTWIKAHLQHCSICHEEAESLQGVKLHLSRLPRREAPTQLMTKLKKQFIGPSWMDRFLNWISQPVVWKPVGALAVTVLLVGPWVLTQTAGSSDEFVDLEPLLAAHNRYQAEGMVPQADMVGSNYSMRLASYYGDEN